MASKLAQKQRYNKRSSQFEIQLVLNDLLSSKDLIQRDNNQKKLSNIPYSFNNIPETYDNIQLEHSINSFDQSHHMHSLKYLLTDEKKQENFREIPELDEEASESIDLSQENVNQTPQFEDQKQSNFGE